MDLIDKTTAAFKTDLSAQTDHLRFFRAPGRVNIIGEHTDYNDGFVLPVAINFDTVVAARPRADSQVRVFAVDEGSGDQFDLQQPIAPQLDKVWANYVRGMAKMLLAEGKKLSGVEMTIAGNVPRSGGLSSSASLEMALGHMFLSLSDEPIDPVALALTGQKTENQFVGVNCGIMDQFIASLGQANHAVLIDCRSLSYTPTPIPADTAIVVVDSGINRGLVDSEYNQRRQECETAARHFGLKALRDLDIATLQNRADELEPIVFRRARHVITENDRTLAAAQMLNHGQMAELGPLMAQSHQSMRADFEITVPGIDKLVEILQAVPNIYGARMTGGGFGGCCIALAPVAVAPEVQAAVETHYQAETGYQPTVYTCLAADGAGEIT